MYAIYQLPADIMLINTKTIVLDLNEGYSHNTYQGLSKRRLCLEYVRRKVSNMPGVNLRQYFAFAHTSSFSPRVITWLEPAIQTKTSTWSVVNLKKTQPQKALNLSMQCGQVILVSGYLVLTAVKYNMNVQYQRCTCGDGATFIFQGIRLGLVYRHTYEQSHDKLFEIDGLPNFLRYGAPRTCLRCAGTRLWSCPISFCNQ